METIAQALTPLCCEDAVKGWLKEDAPSFDIGGFVVGDRPTIATIYGKASGILCGTPFVNAVFQLLKCTIDWHIIEGEQVEPGAQGKVAVAHVKGPAQRILYGERTALNILSRASGIATEASRSIELAKKYKWAGAIAGTRKTTPGFRIVEKYALLVGGAATHRHDLSQMVMLKDNHIWSMGSIEGAIRQARRLAGFAIKIEVEVGSLEEALEAAQAGADIVMLDNFQPESLHRAAADIKQRFPGVTIEASGGISAFTLHQFFGPHIDVISRGSLTQGYSTIDFSMKVQPSSVC